MIVLRAPLRAIRRRSRTFILVHESDDFFMKEIAVTSEHSVLPLMTALIDQLNWNPKDRRFFLSKVINS